VISALALGLILGMRAVLALTEGRDAPAQTGDDLDQAARPATAEPVNDPEYGIRPSERVLHHTEDG
jgi:hypothetical protein